MDFHLLQFKFLSNFQIQNLELGLFPIIPMHYFHVFFKKAIWDVISLVDSYLEKIEVIIRRNAFSQVDYVHYRVAGEGKCDRVYLMREFDEVRQTVSN